MNDFDLLVTEEHMETVIQRLEAGEAVAKKHEFRMDVILDFDGIRTPGCQTAGCLWGSACLLSLDHPLTKTEWRHLSWSISSNWSKGNPYRMALRALFFQNHFDIPKVIWVYRHITPDGVMDLSDWEDGPLTKDDMFVLTAECSRQKVEYL